MQSPHPKVAPVNHDIENLLRSRWSPRAFDDRPVTRGDVLRLIEAARWAPSCANEQPWRFIVAMKDDGDSFERVFACLAEGNRRWASRASVLIVAAAKLSFDRNGAANRHASHDVGLALANLLIQATAMGLVGHPMAGFDAEAVRTACQIPTGFDPMTVTALGYPGDPDSLDEGARTRELAARERLPASRIAFVGSWGHELR